MTMGIQNVNFCNEAYAPAPAITKTSVNEDTNISFAGNEEGDAFVSTAAPAEATAVAEENSATKIGTLRVMMNRLKKDQIAEVNATGDLPKNAKIVTDPETGKLKIKWNLCDFTEGTHKIPEGYELKNDILGFTHVVREGTQAWYLKK